MSKEIIAAVRELEEAKGIDGEVLLTALEDALLAAYKKTPRAADHARVVLDRDSGDIHVHAILLDEEAFRAHPGVRYPDPEELEAASEEAAGEVGENGEPSEPVEPEPIIDWSQFSADQVEVSDVMQGDFGRIAAQTAKQVILQRIREAEREMMFAKYQGRVGDVVTGIVQQSDSRYTLVDLGGVEALLPGSEQVPGERYEHGARIKAVIIEVRSGTKGPQIVLSRRSEELIRELFELEVPEIESGHVLIRAVAREAGYRAKIAVESRAQGVDPVGACVGPRGSRVRMVVAELRGEKIDIIPWNDEPARFVAKALAPARVREVLVDDENEQATVIVPDDQLALAIGREGQNARLATRLTGWRIDIKSESEFAEEEAEIAFSGGEGDDAVGGRCAAILGSGRRCPNSALPGSRYCGIPAHRELAAREEAPA
jgi:N utilization substance protein A